MSLVWNSISPHAARRYSNIANCGITDVDVTPLQNVPLAIEPRSNSQQHHSYAHVAISEHNHTLLRAPRGSEVGVGGVRADGKER